MHKTSGGINNKKKGHVGWWSSQVALVVKNPSANAADLRDTGLIPGLGRSPGGGEGNSCQYSCLENPMDKRAWLATVHGVEKSWTWLSNLACMWGDAAVMVMWVCVSGCLPWAGQLGLGRSLWYRNELRTGGSSLQRGHMKTITWEISGWSRMSRAKGGNRELHGAM